MSKIINAAWLPLTPTGPCWLQEYWRQREGEGPCRELSALTQAPSSLHKHFMKRHGGLDLVWRPGLIPMLLSSPWAQESNWSNMRKFPIIGEKRGGTRTALAEETAHSRGQRATRLALTGCGRQDLSWVGQLSKSRRPWRMAGIRDTVVGTRDPCSQGHRQHGGLTMYPQHSRSSSTNAPNAGLPDAFLSAISDLGGLLSHTQARPGVTHNEPPRGSFQQ